MQDNQLLRELSRPLYAGRGWLTLLGILSIVYGLVIALSIVGLIVAWIPIWIGVLLIQAGSALKQAHNNDDATAMVRAMAKLKTYFTIWGVIALLMLLAWLPLMLLGLSMGYFSSFHGWHTLDRWPAQHISSQRRTEAGAVPRFQAAPSGRSIYLLTERRQRH